MNLVIVESPTKARTIGRFLGKDYEIKASMGHVIDLPKSTLAVDTEHNFAPDFEVVADKKKIISELKSAAKNAQSITLATDPDREGEAIASHVKDMLSSNSKFKIQNSKFLRVVFHEITKEAIEEAFKHPRSVDENLVNAQTARRVLDRLVGYKLSPLLWQKVRRGLSAGRVQSVALRLIVEREKEIEKFKKEQYYTIEAVLAGSALQVAGSTKDEKPPATSHMPRATSFDLIEINGEKIETSQSFSLYDGEYKVTKTSVASKEDADKIVAALLGKDFEVSDVLQKETKRSPQPPYTTSTLQQDAARRLGLNGKRTMSLAQKLYEEGYITYHRTDSVAIALSAQNMLRSFIEKEYGQKYLSGKPRFYATKQKLAQEAHEAIRPTSVGKVSSIKYQVSSIAGEIGWRLFEMIWKRAVASQMSDAVIESTIILADTVSSVILGSKTTPESDSGQARMTNNKYRFKATGSVLVFDGFLKVNPQALQDNRLPQFETGEKLSAQNIESVFHETPPPPRYNDASLIKTLEEKEIGRPSTYATIVSTIESRGYIERSAAKFIPTAVGVAVNDFLVSNFSDIDDIPFTAEMEDSLDAVAEGKKDWVSMMRDFYTPFNKKLSGMKDVARVKIETEEINENCPQCGSKLVVRTGRFGKFISCSTFPDCKFTKPFVEETNFTCPKDNGKIIVKKTRKGRKFYGCSNYPACNFAAWKLEDIKINSQSA